MSVLIVAFPASGLLSRTTEPVSSSYLVAAATAMWTASTKKSSNEAGTAVRTLAFE